MSEQPSSSLPFDRVPARPMGARAGHIVPLPPAEIAYAFLGASIPAELSAWCHQKGWVIEPQRVYLRTAKHLYWTPYRRLGKLLHDLERIAARPFLATGRACVVNVHRIAALDAGGRIPLLVFVAVDGRSESITVSRRCWPHLRERLSLPRRM